MEDIEHKTAPQGERKFFKPKRTDFRSNNNRNGGRPNNRPNRGRDRQKGMVTAFVQGKGQNAALEWLMTTRTPVSVFLITGVKFEGLISAFDAFTISVTDIKKHQQMIYKDKISTITVKKPEAPQAQHRGFKKPFSVATPGVSHPLRGDLNDTPDDGVTLPDHPVKYMGN